MLGYNPTVVLSMEELIALRDFKLHLLSDFTKFCNNFDHWFGCNYWPKITTKSKVAFIPILVN